MGEFGADQLSKDIPFLSATRRNHAIEHATIAVLFRRRGAVVRVFAHSDPWGFHIHGPFTTEEVESAAAEAIQRLRAGERSLAVTHLCGTNIAVAAVMAGGAALLAAGKSRRQNWSRSLTASMAGIAASGRVGLTVQRYVTTDAEIGDAYVSAATLRGVSPNGARLVRISIEG